MPTDTLPASPRFTPARVLVVPGLRGSGEGHWQTWLQSQFRGARRVVQADPDRPAPETWAARIAEVLDDEPAGEWVAVAHSFGCLALARHLARREAADHRIAAALMVAPAEPARFGLEGDLPAGPLALPGFLLASRTDPWMTASSARRWAGRWGLACIDLGDVGHINLDSGFGPLPVAKRLTQQLVHVLQRRHRREAEAA